MKGKTRKVVLGGDLQVRKNGHMEIVRKGAECEVPEALLEKYPHLDGSKKSSGPALPPPQTVESSLEKLTVAKLKEHAAALVPPVDLAGATKKADIIKAIIDAQGVEVEEAEE